MKAGTKKLQYDIEGILYDHHVTGSRRRIAKAIVDAVTAWVGDDDMNREWNIGHGFPEALEPIVRKLEEGLGLRMKRDDGAAKVYEWVAEQEKNGHPMSKFIAWATDKARVQYVGKYRNSPEAIRIDYKMAFESGQSGSHPRAETL